MRNDYVVYIHKNILNGKVYVGQTCNLSERWRNNGKNYFNSIKFYNAIKKYGWDNFTHEVAYSNLNKQAADKLEKELIHKYNSIEEGYNLKEGGSRGELSTKSLANMKPLITRALDKNFSKITKALELIADKDGNVDVEGILTEMMENLMTTNPFSFKTSFIGDIEA